MLFSEIHGVRKCFPVAWGRSLVRPRAFGVLWRFVVIWVFFLKLSFLQHCGRFLIILILPPVTPKVKNLTVLGISFGGLLLGDRVKRSGSF